MTTIPKPKHCGQQWLEMTPTNGGRVCGQCSKVIVDFSKMTWSEIEQMQRQNNNSVCGMYSQRQLENWGQEIPSTTYSKLAAATALLISLTVPTQSSGQIAATKDTVVQTIVHGTITGNEHGNLYNLRFTPVKLKDTNLGVISDEHGNYQIDITDYIDTIPNPTVIFSTTGFYSLELKLDHSLMGEINYNPQLIRDDTEIISFEIRQPTLGQKIKWKFKKWFGWIKK